MNLTDEQKSKVSEWIAAGCKLAEIQTRLTNELGVKLTYMEVRFLVDDLKLVPKDAEPTKPVVLPAPEKSAGPNPAEAPPAAAALKKGAPVEDPAVMPGGVSVTVDQLTRPGALVSGKVKFSDGQMADWYLDQMGRLGVVPKVQGYKPSAMDVQEFQMALQNELARLGL